MTTPACPSAETIRELISAQLDDQLSAAEADQLVGHLAACAECQAHRERLTKAVRLLRSSGPLLPLERAALTDLETQLELTALDEATEEGCDKFIELQSAQLDGELNAEETDALLAHLPRCSVCQAHRRRLQKLERGIEPELELVRVDEGTFAALDRKLDAALAEELSQGLSRDGSTTEVAPEAQPAGRVIPFPAQAARIAVAAAVLLLAVLVTWRGVTSLKDIAGWGDPDRVDPRVQKGDYQPLPTKTPTPAPATPSAPTIVKGTAEPSPTPNTTQVATTGTPQPTPSPTPTVVRTPAPTPTPSPSGSPPPKTRVRDPKPTPTSTPQPAIALAELKTILTRIERGKDDLQVPDLIASLGAAKFEHDLTYGLLGSVLGGKLDGYTDPNACRRSAYQALGKLGTPRAVQGLLRAPLRRLHADHDAAALGQALASLQRDDAIGALSRSLLRRRPLRADLRLVVVTALADLARPAGGPGLLGLLAARGQPRELVREAARALGRSGHPKAFAELKRILETDRRLLARQGSAFGLGALAARDPQAPVAERAIEELERNLPDKKLLVSEACVDGLGASRSRGAVAPLITCLGPNEKRPTIRRRARLALCTLAGEEPKGVRTAEEWDRWFKGLSPARPIGQRRLDGVDLTSFRQAPARSTGVVFVIDTSGSMSDKRRLMVFELEQALEQLPPHVKFQVLFFGDAPRALWSRQRLRPATLANRRRALAAARAQPIVKVAQTVLKKTLREALAHPEADAIYLISDGLMTPDDLTSLRPTVRRWNRTRTRPAQIHCVHLRQAGGAVRLRLAAPNYKETIWDMNFMHRLAAENDGDYAHN